MEKIKKAVILAAGLNSRLMPAAKVIPKTLFPIEGKPIIHHSVEECIDSGIKEVVIVTRDKNHLVEKYFKPDFELRKLLKEFKKYKALKKLKELDKLHEKCKIHFVQQKRPLGEAHAIVCAKKYVQEGNFAVLLGDTVYKTKEPVIKQLIDKFYKEKRPILRTGRFVLTSGSLEYLSKFDYENPRFKDKNTLHMLGKRKTVYAEVIGEYIDSGTFTRYISAVELFEKKK